MGREGGREGEKGREGGREEKRERRKGEEGERGGEGVSIREKGEWDESICACPCMHVCVSEGEGRSGREGHMHIPIQRLSLSYMHKHVLECIQSTCCIQALIHQILYHTTISLEHYTSCNDSWYCTSWIV